MGSIVSIGVSRLGVSTERNDLGVTGCRLLQERAGFLRSPLPESRFSSHFVSYALAAELVFPLNAAVL